MEEVSTPGTTTIGAVANFLGVPRNQTLKMVFYTADGELTFVVIRGDLEVNEVKLKNALKCTELRLATEDELIAAGIVPGFASPVGISNIKVIADDSITTTTNLVAGANKPDTHLKNVNFPRDFPADIVTDIALAQAGDGCPKCGGKLLLSRGIEVGHAFKLGTFLSERLGAAFIDPNGNPQPIVMGSYGIGLGRLLAAAVEQNHDDKGIIWPPAIAPYQVYLCPLYQEKTPVAEVTEKLYQELTAEGLEILLDDRDESPGVKFNDADLLGIPLRITISPRTLEKNSVELKRRSEKESELVPLERAAGHLREMVRSAG